jgi:phenylalanyl-tRNA synthetase beta chain
MIVSWNWLKDYLPLDMSPEELALRLAMAGLNHEGTETVGDDLAIDIEVTSNRPDCLGHLGIAREIAVLWDLPLTHPDPKPISGAAKGADLIQVSIESPALCPRYTARVIQGVTIGPSPQWLQDRLATLGIASVNNVVDISNYVLMECGQPLHIFDYANIQGGQIIVRNARPKEQFLAIDHRTYELGDSMCVIADAKRPLALGGVMGGADSEVSATTVDILIEAADFDSLAIRRTSRALKLFSPSSYRFERTVDPEGTDWASRRCAELILEHAGGELAMGVVDVRAQPQPPAVELTLRMSQLKRVLGIEIPSENVRRILSALGNEEKSATAEKIVVVPPSWRRDLHREIDLVEEVARIHGYDQIPEDVGVAMVASQKSTFDRVVAKTRQAMTAWGFDEAMTTSVVSQSWSEAASFWTDQTPIETITPMLRGANFLRRSLIPSLLGALRANEAQQNEDVSLFEIAKIYLPQSDGLPEEPWMLGLVAEADLLELKSVIRSVMAELNKSVELRTADAAFDLGNQNACKLMVGDQTVGYLAEISAAGKKQFELRRSVAFAEVRLDRLHDIAELVPQYREQSSFPAIRRDLNLIVEEDVRWAALADTVSATCGDLLDTMEYRETFRNAKKDGPGKKRLMFSFQLRAPDRTLTREEADEISARVVDRCASEHGAVLVA